MYNYLTIIKGVSEVPDLVLAEKIYFTSSLKRAIFLPKKVASHLFTT